MSWFVTMRNELYALLDRILNLSGYFEGVIYDRESVAIVLRNYVSHLIEYFEDIPVVDSEEKNNEKLKALKRFLGIANSSLREMHCSPQRLLQDLEGDLLFMVIKGIDCYAERSKYLGTSKSIFDAKSSEIKHLLYMMDGAEDFIFRDIFIKTAVIKGRLMFDLDRDALESRKFHEFEFTAGAREKHKSEISREG